MIPQSFSFSRGGMDCRSFCVTSDSARCGLRGVSPRRDAFRSADAHRCHRTDQLAPFGIAGLIGIAKTLDLFGLFIGRDGEAVPWLVGVRGLRLRPATFAEEVAPQEVGSFACL